MFAFESEAMLTQDREDLIALLGMKFGRISGEMIEEIYDINDVNTLQRLILAAANAANWQVFLEEFHAGREAFRVVGESFNPLRDLLNERSDWFGAEEK